MFNCQLCNHTTKPRVSQHRVVVAKRQKANGWEIAKEIVVCPSCKDSLEKEEKIANGNT